MKVREIATTKLKMVTPEFALRNVRDLFVNNDFRHLPVVDEGRGVVGIVSERELEASARFAREFGGDRDEYEEFLDQPVSKFLKSRFGDLEGLVCVEADETVQEAARLLVDERLSALPVVDEEGELFGIVSYVDILRSLCDL